MKDFSLLFCRGSFPFIKWRTERSAISSTSRVLQHSLLIEFTFPFFFRVFRTVRGIFIGVNNLSAVLRSNPGPFFLERRGFSAAFVATKPVFKSLYLTVGAETPAKPVCCHSRASSALVATLCLTSIS
ncbi:hypothetical protein ATANTOWER_011865 [Ataeniobius toweri]|uniref:Uncharacterized protein n=1 Tax=Ataeniobius toweri TaxID=208326 RepID=A0ABU7B0L5_9TELE|nr:hypothetical protein [Ataeniobius toweri]